MTASYHQVLDWLYHLEATRGMDFKLDRTATVLAELGDPQRSFRSVHVAGTNGKGSVAAMTHAVLRAAGKAAGLYTSPHLVDFTERIRTHRGLIGEDEVVELAAEVRAVMDRHQVALTFFELTTVLAFLHFARAGVEVAVIEVGLGGRLDATNVIRAEVAVITSIALDHQEFLGDSIAAIAGEKAGIIKPQQAVIVGHVPSAARDVIEAAAANNHARVSWLGEEFDIHPGDPFTFEGLGRRIERISLSLKGDFQRTNGAIALAASVAYDRLLSAAYRSTQPTISDEAVREGLARTEWPGRLEIASDRPKVILDCAHNPEAVRALLPEVRAMAAGRPVHLLFAAMRDKRWREMAVQLAPAIARCTVTCVNPPRGEDPRVLADEFCRWVPTAVVSDPATALRGLLDRTPADDLILVTGSLFLVGAVSPLFHEESLHR